LTDFAQRDNAMKKKLLTYLFSSFSILSFGQGFVNNSQINLLSISDSLEVGHTVGFNMGFGPTCPQLDSVKWNTQNDTLQIDIFYDITGPWPSAFCIQYTEFALPYDTSTCVIIANTHVFQYYPTTPFYDTTFNQWSNIELICPTGIIEYQVEEFSIVPNPATEGFRIKSMRNHPIQEIQIFTLDGQVCEEIIHLNGWIYLPKLKAGMYLIRVKMNELWHTKRLILN